MRLNHLTDTEIQTALDMQTGTLSEETREHLAACLSCRRELSAYRELAAEMNTISVFPGDDPAFVSRVMRRLPESPKALRQWDVVRTLVRSLASVLLLALILVPFDLPAPST
ncbi:MAG: hypothetical protein D6800_12525, partial [Candidatus Zixiibacteriota bacterium]